MKLLAPYFVLCVTFVAHASAQLTGDADIITDGVSIKEDAGIMMLSTTVKNNTKRDFKKFKIKVEFMRGVRVVHTLYLQDEDPLEAGEQSILSSRSESTEKPWTDYRTSFYDGTKPLFYRAPKAKPKIRKK